MILCHVGDIKENATEQFHLQTRAKTRAESEFEVFSSSLGQSPGSNWASYIGGNLPLLLALWQMGTPPPPFLLHACQQIQ